ncbi:MAG: thioredoxin family protein [Planctomycetota bacterium]|nr:MAG: thioredoxin family protein [Planctomycetota bacterium]
MREGKGLGMGCAKCEKLFENVKRAAEEVGVEIALEKVTNISKIMGFGVMVTPALVVDGEVKAVGKVLSVEQIKELLTKER